MAAVLLATSCSKDDNGDFNNSIESTEVVNTNESTEVVQSNIVKIPFSVKVDKGLGISKIAYSGDGTVITRAFETSDLGTELTVTGEGIESSTLTLKGQGGNYFFEGDINVIAGNEDKFTTGEISLTGTFGKALVNPTSSIESLAELMRNCDHQYKANFTSGDNDITLYDQNAYLYFKLAASQIVLKISTGEYEAFKTNSEDGTKEIWIAVPGGTTVSGNLVSQAGKTAEAAHVITLDRTKVVDMQLDGGVLWATSNLGATNPGDYGNYCAWTETETLGASNGLRMPNSSDLTTLKNQTKTKETQDGNNGLKFYTAYGSVFLPAAGIRGGSGTPEFVGSLGYYWSSSVNAGYPNDAEYLYFDLNGGVAVNPNGSRTGGQRVRLVRVIN